MSYQYPQYFPMNGVGTTGSINNTATAAPSAAPARLRPQQWQNTATPVVSGPDLTQQQPNTAIQQTTAATVVNPAQAAYAAAAAYLQMNPYHQTISAAHQQQQVASHFPFSFAAAFPAAAQQLYTAAATNAVNPPGAPGPHPQIGYILQGAPAGTTAFLLNNPAAAAAAAAAQHQSAALPPGSAQFLLQMQPQQHHQQSLGFQSSQHKTTAAPNSVMSNTTTNSVANKPSIATTSSISTDEDQQQTQSQAQQTQPAQSQQQFGRAASWHEIAQLCELDPQISGADQRPLAGKTKTGGMYFCSRSLHRDVYMLFPNKLAYINNFISYYFSSANLRKDQAFIQLMNSAGEVPVSQLVTFPRLEQIGTTEQELIDAVYQNEQLLVVDTGPAQSKSVRRRDGWCPSSSTNPAASAPVSVSVNASGMAAPLSSPNSSQQIVSPSSPAAAAAMLSWAAAVASQHQQMPPQGASVVSALPNSQQQIYPVLFTAPLFSTSAVGPVPHSVMPVSHMPENPTNASEPNSVATSLAEQVASSLKLA